MKIKKTIKAPGAEGAASGGAAIADRFRLDAAPGGKKKASSKTSTAVIVAFCFGLIGLGLVGFLLWKFDDHLKYTQSPEPIQSGMSSSATQTADTSSDTPVETPAE